MNFRKLATKKWYVIDSETKCNYSHGDPITFLTKSIESNLCDYSDPYLLVTGKIAVTRTIAAAGAQPQRKQVLTEAIQVAFKNCAPLKDCRTEISDTFVDYADFINIAMHMYNLIEYSDNYSDTSGSLWNLKRDEIIGNINVTNNNSSSFKYKSNLIGDTDADGANRKKENVKIAVPLKYLSNFWRSLEMSLINCKAELSLRRIESCVLIPAAMVADIKATDADSATFEITDARI